MMKSSCSNMSSCDRGENFSNSKPTVIRIQRQKSALMKVNGRNLHTCRYCPRRFPSWRALGGHMRTHVPSSVSPPLHPPPLSSSSSDAELISSSFDHANSTFGTYPRPAGSLFLSQAIGNEEEEEEEEERNDEEGEDVVSVRRSICYDYPGGSGQPKLYTLRRNPKRNMRFVEKEFDLSTAPSLKKLSKRIRVDSIDGNLLEENILSDPPPPSRAVVRSCSECGRVFSSCKALFGHMRCHPERSWRGIQPPLEDSATSPSLKKIPGLIQVDSISKNLSEENILSDGIANSINRESSLTQSTSMSLLLSLSGSLPKPSDDNESDSGSIKKETKKEREEEEEEEQEEFVIDARRLHSQRVTGKRSRRSRCANYTPSPLQISDFQEDQTEDVATTPSESKEERDMANCLIMLAQAGRDIEENSGFEDSDDDYEDDRASMVDGDHSGIDGMNHAFVFNAAKKVDSIDSAPKYQCLSCRRVFTCHQALGGHRASHRKVKGCFARMNPDREDVVMESAEDCDEEEANKKVVSYGFQPIVEEIRRPNIPSRKGSKVHRCNICGEEFGSGQALGGHKRKHWNGERAIDTANIAPRTQQQGIRNDPREGGRGIFLDLNSPAPLYDDHLSFYL